MMTPEQISRLVELMARSKAIWMVPALLNLTESAISPNNAYDLVLNETGRRRAALAARWLVIARQEFDPDLVGACGRWLKYTKRGTESLKQFLNITFKP